MILISGLDILGIGRLSFLYPQGATGQLQAIGYANQLASQQANQLLQIRAMLLAQQNAIAAKAAADQDQAARDQAMEGSMTKGTYNMPTPQTF